MVALDSGLVKTVMLKILGDNGDANRALDEIAAKSEALKELRPDMTPMIDRARAQAEALVAKAEMRRIFAEPIKVPVELDTDRGLGWWLKTGLSKKGWGALAGLIPGVSAGPAAGEAAPAAASGLRLLATPVGAAIAAALVAGPGAALFTTLLGGAVGAGGAFGAFALASHANTGLTALQGNVTTAQQAVAQARQSQNFYPSPANAAALATAMTNLAQANQAVAAFQKANAPALGLYAAGQNVASVAAAAFVSALTGNATRQVQSSAAAHHGGGGVITEQIPGSSFLTGLEKIINQIPAFIRTVAPQLGQMFRASLPYVEGFVKILEGFASRVLPAVTAALNHFARFIPDVVHFFNGLSDVVDAVIRTLGKLAEYFGELNQQILRTVRWARSQWDRFGHDMANWAQNVEDWINKAVTWFLGLPDRIWSALSGLPGQLLQLGKDMISGLIQGLQQVPIIGPVISLGEKIIGLFRSATGSHSPSVKAMAIGRDFSQGFYLGLSQAGSGVGINVKGYGGGGSNIVGVLRVEGGDGPLTLALVQALRGYIQSRGGGPNSVQHALGQF